MELVPIMEVPIVRVVLMEVVPIKKVALVELIMGYCRGC